MEFPTKWGALFGARSLPPADGFLAGAWQVYHRASESSSGSLTFDFLTYSEPFVWMDQRLFNNRSTTMVDILMQSSYDLMHETHPLEG